MKDDTIESNGAQYGPFFLSHCQHFQGIAKNIFDFLPTKFWSKGYFITESVPSTKEWTSQKGFYVLNVLY